MNETYLASEDSAFIREALGSYSGGRCLELGAGNAGNLVAACKNFGHVVGTDLVKPSMEDWKVTGADVVETNLALCFIDESFDLVFFNPPYIETDQVTDRTTDAGRGSRVAIEFLTEAMRTAKKDGKVLMLWAGEISPEVRKVCGDLGFLVKKIGSKRLFYEDLAMYELSRMPVT